MLKLGTRVEYGNQIGRIVGRTIELQPKYDIMLANGTIRSYVREVDLVVRPLPAPTDDTLAESSAPPMSVGQPGTGGRNR